MGRQGGAQTPQCFKAKKYCEWYVTNCGKKTSTATRKSPLKKKRCPKGSRRNKKTGNCQSTTTGTVVSKKKTVRVLTARKAYSPSINRELTLRAHDTHVDPFGCGLGKVLARGSPNYRKATGEPKVQTGVKKDGSPICVGWKTKAAQDVMLRNMNLRAVNCSQIIAPAQKHSNCWFNTMFMALFISDKGRKFFRFFREQMIKGVHFIRSKELGTKKFVKKPISPPSLRKAFFLFNAAIDASLFGRIDGKLAAPELLADTNNLISMIYKSINKTKPTKAVIKQGLRDIHSAGNPYAYYSALVNYLGDGEVDSSRHGLRMVEVDSVNMARYYAKDRMRPPDVIAVSTDEGTGKFDLKNSFKLKSKSGEEAKYEMDSMIVRDTEGRHFCALLTCNSEGFGFDGESYKKMTKYDWKKKSIQLGQSWSFKGSVWSGTDNQIVWNLSKAYSLAFYYRT